jgi:hypothetical protein
VQFVPYATPATSTYPASAYSLRTMPELFQQLLTHSSVSQPVLIAESLGGVPVVFQAYRVV